MTPFEREIREQAFDQCGIPADHREQAVAGPLFADHRAKEAGRG